MIQSTDKNGNTTQKFVKATVYGEDELESTEEEEFWGSIYYIDMSNFKEEMWQSTQRIRVNM